MPDNLTMKIIKELLDKKNRELRKPYGHDIPDGVRDFHKNVDTIIKEWKAYVSQTSLSGIPIDELSEDQKLLNEDKKWKAFFVFIYGEYNPEALKYFPETIKLVEKWKEEIKLVFFSNMEPGKHIPAHNGNNHGVIRAQLGIDIQEPETTGLRVEDKINQLKNGELFIFDDTFEHEAWNNGKGSRVVLIIDSRKKFPHFYNLINKYLLNRMKQTTYIQSALAKLKEKNKN